MESQIEALLKRVRSLREGALRGHYTEDELSEFRQLADQIPAGLNITKKELTQRSGLSIGYWRTTRQVYFRPRLSNYMKLLNVFSEICDEHLNKYKNNNNEYFNNYTKNRAIYIASQSLLISYQEARREFENKKPNEEADLNDFFEFMNLIDALIRALSDLISFLENNPKEIILENKTKFWFKTQNKIESWFDKNSEHAIDCLVKLPILSAGIGLLNICGAHMPTATAAAAALVVGPKIMASVKKKP